MAKVFDFSKLPAKLKITNTNKATPATDAGSDVYVRYEVVKYADAVKDEIDNGLPYVAVSFDSNGALEYVRVARKYKVTDRHVKFYWTNVGKVLEAGDSMTVTAKTSAAVAHYMSYDGVNGITVETVEDTTDEDTEKV